MIKSLIGPTGVKAFKYWKFNSRVQSVLMIMRLYCTLHRKALLLFIFFSTVYLLWIKLPYPRQQRQQYNELLNWPHIGFHIEQTIWIPYIEFVKLDNLAWSLQSLVNYQTQIFPYRVFVVMLIVFFCCCSFQRRRKVYLVVSL